MRWLGTLALLAALAPSSAHAYARTTEGDGGACLYWGGRTVPFRINQGGLAALPFEALQASIGAGFEAWDSWPCSDFTFVDDGATSSAMVGYDRVLVAQPDLAGEVANEHLVVFREQACADVAPPEDDCWLDRNDDCDNKYDCWQGESSSGDALAFTVVTSELSTGRILDADTAFDAFDFQFRDLVTGGCDGTVDADRCADVQDTMAHEAGHFLGLAHSDDASATMYFAVTGLNETSKRDLSADDVNGLCAIYPLGQPTSTCGHPELTVRASGCGCAGAGSGLALWAWLLPLLQMAKRRRLH